MSDKWKKVKLGSLGDIITGKTPKTNDKENYGNDVLFLTPSDNMELRYIKDTIRKLSLKGAETVQNKILPKESICVSCIGSQLGKVVITTEDTVTNQQINSIIPNDDVDYKYLYYTMLLVGNKLNFLSKTSTAVPIINKTEFSNQEIYLPPLEEQKSIADLLSSFDDKIENNNAIIANLEEQAQAIFKSWFIDFEPFQDGEFVESELGSIPKACKVEYLLDLIEFKGGSQPPKKEHIYEYKDGYVRFIQNRDYNGNNNHLTYIKESKKNRYADRYDILMDKYGEAGKTRYGIEGAYNVALAKIKPNNISLREYIRRFLEQDSVQDYIYNSSMASTRPSVNKKS